MIQPHLVAVPSSVFKFGKHLIQLFLMLQFWYSSKTFDFGNNDKLFGCFFIYFFIQHQTSLLSHYFSRHSDIRNSLQYDVIRYFVLLILLAFIRLVCFGVKHYLLIMQLYFATICALFSFLADVLFRCSAMIVVMFIISQTIFLSSFLLAAGLSILICLLVYYDRFAQCYTN